MTLSFNLLHQPWIPCLFLDGSVRELGLAETLARAHQISSLEAATPMETAALHRLLLAVLHRVFGPQNRAAWAELWQAGRWNSGALEDYFQQWERRFDLFDPERPFYQRSDERVEARNILLVLPGLSASSFYNHPVDDGTHSISPAQAGRIVVAIQNFGLSGICHPQKGLYFNAAPCIGGVVFLIQGNNLFETLALNLVPYNESSPDQVLRKTDADLPCWEQDDPFQPERQAPHGYLDYLTWQNRRVRLIPEVQGGQVVIRQATASPGLRLSQELRDPMKHFRIDEKRGIRPIQASQGRVLWRDSTALFRIRSPAEQPPRAFSHVNHLILDEALDRAARYRSLAYCMVSDQAKVEFYRAEQMPLPLAYLENETLVNELDTALQQAEGVRVKLWTSVRSLAELLIAPQSDLKDGRKPDSKDINNLISHFNYEWLYWQALELPFYALMDALPGQGLQALDAWQQVLIDAARAALEDAIAQAGETPAALKASVTARNVLGYSLKKLFSTPVLS
jgi:CRISPR system Cascade subunit CasA